MKPTQLHLPQDWGTHSVPHTPIPDAQPSAVQGARFAISHLSSRVFEVMFSVVW